MVEAAPLNLRYNDIFISYSRRDKDFAQRLVSAFKQFGRDPWIDWEDIADGAAWRTEIAVGIREADAFVFVISPDAIVSPECLKELEQAIQFNKRIIPIVYRSVTTTHPALAALQWIFFCQSDDFDAAFQKLLTAIDADRKHTQTHTRYLMRAMEWEDGRDEGFLLRGKDLKAAEAWLTLCEGKDPQPTELQRKYIMQSLLVETAEQRLLDAGRKATRIISLSILSGLIAAATIGLSVTQANNRMAALVQEQQKLTAEIRQKQAEIDNLVSVQQQLSGDRSRLIGELERYGWSQAAIDTLLKSKDGQFARRLAESRAANSRYQKSLNRIQSAESTQPAAITIEYSPPPEALPPLAKAFDNLGLKRQPNPAQAGRTPNVIFYGADVPPEQVKAVAYALIRAGVEIRAIQPLTSPATTIRVSAIAQYESSPALSVKQIQGSALPVTGKARSR